MAEIVDLEEYRKALLEAAPPITEEQAVIVRDSGYERAVLVALREIHLMTSEILEKVGKL
ncbi:hypothetical protein ACL02T_20305 [Pseudonocardia sp. RS010]|uniref:hypothetical protein n=1 Tax=Pseudonocardia sp. RS010 TaxID=3385979 RepID=UPI0039A2062D